LGGTVHRARAAAWKRWIDREVPLKRFGRPEEIGSVAGVPAEPRGQLRPRRGGAGGRRADPVSGPEFLNVDAGEVRLRVAVQGSGPLVLMVHGFPESWYSWRHQLGPVAEAGFTAAAIDVRGYGGSDRPQPVEAYAMNHMVADIVGAADALSPGEPVVLLGHDWGAPMVWSTALTRPDRIRAVAALSVPWFGIAERSFRAVFEEVFTNRGPLLLPSLLPGRGRGGG
jgi:pimeloyl-ACP methyl ester carboxylesterase